MKILFVYSGNSKFFPISPFVKSQAESLERRGIDIDYFPIRGKGLRGYLRNIPKLRKYIRENNPDIIHAHYSLSGWVSVLARSGKYLVLSLMGSDTYGNVLRDGKTTRMNVLTRFQVWLLQFFYPAIVVKSNNLKELIWKKKACHVIPNGVNYQKFTPMDMIGCRKELKLPINDKLLLFMGKITDARKNYQLIEKALGHIKTKNTQIISPYPVSHEKVPLYYNACDVLVSPSYKEGSPNVIKEALACNTSIVATPSGDIIERVQGLNRVLISAFDEKEFAGKIDQLLNTEIQEDTREIVRSQIDEDIVAQQLISIYRKLNKNVQ